MTAVASDVDESWPGRRVWAFTGSGVGDPNASASYDVIIDIVGGADTPDFLDRLAPNGRLVLVGAVAGMPPADFGMRFLSAFQQSRSVATFSLETDLHAVVHDVLPLDQAADAPRQMDAGTVFGRIVLVP